MQETVDISLLTTVCSSSFVLPSLSIYFLFSPSFISDRTVLVIKWPLLSGAAHEHEYSTLDERIINMGQSKIFFIPSLPYSHSLFGCEQEDRHKDLVGDSNAELNLRDTSILLSEHINNMNLFHSQSTFFTDHFYPLPLLIYFSAYPLWLSTRRSTGALWAKDQCTPHPQCSTNTQSLLPQEAVRSYTLGVTPVRYYPSSIPLVFFFPRSTPLLRLPSR